MSAEHRPPSKCSANSAQWRHLRASTARRRKQRVCRRGVVPPNQLVRRPGSIAVRPRAGYIIGKQMSTCATDLAASSWRPGQVSPETQAASVEMRRRTPRRTAADRQNPHIPPTNFALSAAAKPAPLRPPSVVASSLASPRFEGTFACAFIRQRDFEPRRSGLTRPPPDLHYLRIVPSFGRLQSGWSEEREVEIGRILHRLKAILLEIPSDYATPLRVMSVNFVGR